MKSLILLNEIKRKYRYKILSLVSSNGTRIENHTPIISFTFDDFPLSAKIDGAKILNNYGVKGTYYVSLGLMDTKALDESYYCLDDLRDLDSDGHEIGCHTYDHIHAKKLSAKAYRLSLINNNEAFKRYFPSENLESFSYPFGEITLRIVNIVNKFYSSSRTILPGINMGNVDLTLLKANKLYSLTHPVEYIKKLIDRNCEVNGWLIFYTHDVRNSPSEYGCTPAYFEAIINYAVDSGSIIKPVGETIKLIKTRA